MRTKLYLVLCPRFVRSDLKKIESYFHNLPTIYQLRGANLEENEGDRNDQPKEAKRDLNNLSDGTTIAKLLGYLILLQLYSETLLESQRKGKFPTAVNDDLLMLVRKLRLLQRKFVWPKERLEFLQIGPPEEIVRNLLGRVFNPLLSEGAVRRANQSCQTYNKGVDYHRKATKRTKAGSFYLQCKHKDCTAKLIIGADEKTVKKVYGGAHQGHDGNFMEKVVTTKVLKIISVNERNNIAPNVLHKNLQAELEREHGDKVILFIPNKENFGKRLRLRITTDFGIPPLPKSHLFNFCKRNGSNYVKTGGVLIPPKWGCGGQEVPETGF